MKEVIVIFATVILGVAIAVFVIGLGDTAENLTESMSTEINQLIQNKGATE